MTPAARKTFLAALERSGSLRTAAAKAGAHRHAFDQLRKEDPDFDAACELALARRELRLLGVLARIAKTATPSKPAGDWQAIAYLLEHPQRCREGVAKLALLNEQRAKAKAERDALKRGRGTDPAAAGAARVVVLPPLEDDDPADLVAAEPGAAGAVPGEPRR